MFQPLHRFDLAGRSDASLVEGLGRGEMAALAELVSRHQAGARSLAYRLLHRWDLADDVAQESFLRVMRAAPNYRPTAQFNTWLYRIVVNLCYDELRRTRQLRLMSAEDTGVPAPSDHAGDGAQQIMRDEMRRLVRTAIDELPDRQRVAVLLHRFEGFDHTAIADAMDSTESAVESLLVRAYARLRERLGAWSDFG